MNGTQDEGSVEPTMWETLHQDSVIALGPGRLRTSEGEKDSAQGAPGSVPDALKRLRQITQRLGTQQCSEVVVAECCLAAGDRRCLKDLGCTEQLDQVQI